MIRVIKASERYFRDRDWLQTYWLFSFDMYYDPDNMQWGALRVFNDDVIHPGHGFGMHHHEDAEVVTIPLSGALTHEDSMGNRGAVSENEVQRMSAGSGVEHSERNEGVVPVHLYQIWMMPSVPGIDPSYDQRRLDPASWTNMIFPIVSGEGIHDCMTMNADATIYRSLLEDGERIDYMPGADRFVFIYLTSGRLQVNDTALEANDQARISGEAGLHLRAAEDTEFILVDAAPGGPAERIE